MNENIGIATHLLHLARKEGWPAALNLRTRWQTALKEMYLVANDDQRAAIKLLLGPIDMHRLEVEPKENRPAPTPDFFTAREQERDAREKTQMK